MTEVNPSDNVNNIKDNNISVLNKEKFQKLAHLNGHDLPRKKFPVDVFPVQIQEIIHDTHQSLNFPINFIGTAILGAVSIAIGNTYEIEAKPGYRQSAVLYITLVGHPGTGKSAPLKFALQPIMERDRLSYNAYKEALVEYNKLIKFMKKGKGDQKAEIPEKPEWATQVLLSDFTPEALAAVHQLNQRGIGVYCDEVASWIKNFNRYHNGSEEQFWLMQWCRNPVSINRKSCDPIFIPKPHIPVIGSIQPGVLHELAKNRTGNGFVDRILFAFHDDNKRVYWSETEINASTVSAWNTTLNKLLIIESQYDPEGFIQPRTLRFTEEAKNLYSVFFDRLTDMSNETENEQLKGIYAKMDQYCLRFSLILQLLKQVCTQNAENAIGVNTVNGAIKLVDYFTENAMKVHQILNSSPYERLPGDKRQVFEALPDVFTTAEGKQLASELGMPIRSFHQFLNNQELFNRIKHGEYCKRY